MSDYYKADRDAAAKVSDLLKMPLPDFPPDIWDSSYFDPWELFPLYGSYSSDFDELAIQVLGELAAHRKERDDLAAEMFREILCTMNLCDYGSSPRVCFATSEFEALLPAFIEKWKAYSALKWSDD